MVPQDEVRPGDRAIPDQQRMLHNIPVHWSGKLQQSVNIYFICHVIWETISEILWVSVYFPVLSCFAISSKWIPKLFNPLPHMRVTKVVIKNYDITDIVIYNVKTATSSMTLAGKMASNNEISCGQWNDGVVRLIVLLTPDVSETMKPTTQITPRSHRENNWFQFGTQKPIRILTPIFTLEIRCKYSLCTKNTRPKWEK